MFSIIIINYNKSAFIAEAVKSILSQTFSDWELLIIDDASTDNSVEIIKSFLNDKRIRFFQNRNNLGKTLSLRKGVSCASNDIIVELDSDDYLGKNTLHELKKAYSENTDVGFVYTQCMYCDQKLRSIHHGFSALIPKGKTNLHINSVVALRSFNRKDYFKTEGYDSEILFAEDIDLVLKMEEVTKLFFIDKILYHYRILPNSQTHGSKNVRINRSSTALAKLKAYYRRRGGKTLALNMNRIEISEVLFFGIINAFLVSRWKLGFKFIFHLLLIYPVFFLDPRFYFLIFKKVKKIVKLKKDKPLLKI